ncbi:MAG: hypothetical protein E7547_09285 [Ruminococcaceae bacterium]|nr:hypothetical protein [Oscillospiraceae bacterium]
MKTKKFIAIILTFVLAFCVLTVAQGSAEIPDGFTAIYTADDLSNIRNDLDGKYILMNDIDLSTYGNWEPIGTKDNPFTGVLDGNGYSVFNLTIKGEYDADKTLYFALFTSAEDSKFSDLSIINAQIDVTYTGTTVQTSRVGFIAGYGNCVTVENCITSGYIKVKGFFKNTVGSFFGKVNSTTATNCVNYTDITVDNPAKPVEVSVGGIVGAATYSTISKCCNYGDITVNGTDYDASHRVVYAGGVVGECDELILSVSDCYNRGNICLGFSASSAFAGGVVGDSYAVENCYNTGNITFPEDFNGCVGGVSGNNWSGGLAVMPAPVLKNVYYINSDLFASYSNTAAPDENSFENAKLLTKDEFKNQVSFIGFDFDTVWEMEENGYPILKNQPEMPENIPDRPTTESSTEPSAESTTEPSTEPITEPSTKPDNSECFLIRLLNWIFNLITKVVSFVMNLF